MNFSKDHESPHKSSIQPHSINRAINIEQNNDKQINHNPETLHQYTLLVTQDNPNQKRESLTDSSVGSYSSLPEVEDTYENINVHQKHQNYNSRHFKNKLNTQALANQINHINGHDHLQISDVIEKCVEGSIAFAVPEDQENIQEQLNQEIVDIEVEELQEKNIPVLHCNTITFTKCKNFNQQQILEANGLINKNNLGIKLVTLQFEECKGLNDEDITRIGNSLGGSLTNIEYLNIQLMNCKYVTVEGIKRLIFGVAGRETTIKHLTIVICKLKSITHQSIRELINDLYNSLINLDELKLDIIACIGWTEDNTKGIYGQLDIKDKLSRLKQLEINFYKKSAKSENYQQDLVDYIKVKLRQLSHQGTSVIYDKAVCYKNKLLAKHSEIQELPLESTKK